MDILNCIIKKGKKGFSLAELLIAVGILSVLIAIGFPAVIYFNARLNQTKLDNSARDVFLAAQNKLTAIKSSGREMPEGKSMGKTPPSDFSLTGLEWNNTGNDDTDEYVYVENGDAGFTFMDDTMFGNGYEDGQFIIEFNRHTGQV